MRKSLLAILLALWAALPALSQATTPLLRFACMSDIHNELSMISQADATNVWLRTSFLNTLQSLKNNKPDLIVLGGDYTSDVTIPEQNWRQVRQLMHEATSDAVKADAHGRHPVIYCNGNHDYEVANFDALPKPYNAGDYYTYPMRDNLGALAADECFYESATNGTSDDVSLLAAYHYTVAGFDFVVLNTGKHFFHSAWDYTYSPESVRWVDSKLDEIYADDPDKTVFFICHLPLAGTTGATTGKTISATSEGNTLLKAALAKHPNIIALYGHDHSSTANHSYYEQSLLQRITCYDTAGNIIATPTGTDTPATPTNEFDIRSVSTDKYLGFDSYNMALVDQPNRFVASASSLVSNTVSLFGDNAPTNNNGYIHCGSSGRFSGNPDLTTHSSLYIYEMTASGTGSWTGTHVTAIEAGKTYALVALSSSGGYYALKAEMYNAGSTGQRMTGIAASNAETITITNEAALWSFTAHGAATEPDTPDTAGDTFYIQDCDGSYLDYDGNIKVVGTDASLTQGFKVSASTVTSSPWAGTGSVNMLCLSSSDGRYVHCGSNGNFSGNTAIGNANTSTSLWLYEITGDNTATRVSMPVSGNDYLIIGYKSGKYYQMLNTNNGATGNDLREYSEQLTTMTSPAETITYNGNTAARWRFTAVSAAGTSDAQPSFMSVFMGSMRYNSLDTNASPGIADSPIVQALIVTVYNDRIVLEVQNFGQTGQIAGSAVTANLTDPLPAYTIERTVTHSSGITGIAADEPAEPADSRVYSIDGRLVSTGANSLDTLAKGLYIVGNKKIIVR